MIRSRVCLRRTFQSILSRHNESISGSNRIQPIILDGHHGRLSLLPLSGHRYATSMVGLKKGHHRKHLQKWTTAKTSRLMPPLTKRNGKTGAMTKVEVRDGKARANNRARLLKTSDDSVSSQLPDDRPERSRLSPEGLKEAKLLDQERNIVERHLQDPLRLQEEVLQRLKIPDVESALRLIRASDHFKVANIVSWNHCLDWHLAQGRVKDALAVYNEMKKRGHKPDAHTYTIMLRGLSQNVQRKSATKDAVKIYNSIFAPNSAVKPSTIHTNAVINVCARGGDMESLWAVAGRLPERGAGSPDRLTYTTILNAIRENTIKQAVKTLDTTIYKGDPEEGSNARKVLYQRATQDGKKLWEDVSHRWRRADLAIDEYLVVAMGRLLISCGQEADIEQVLDLLDSTMQIRIPLREQTPRKSNSNKHLTGSEDTSRSPLEILADAPQPKAEEVMVPSMPLDQSNIYAKPGNKTLNLILEACFQSASIRHHAPAYWHELVTSETGPRIQPDAANVVAYLRILRLRRASSRVYDLLNQEWPEDVAKKVFTRGAFVLAISTCMRDNRNQNVFDTAQKLVRLMERKLGAQQRDRESHQMDLREGEYKQRKEARDKFKQEEKRATIEDRNMKTGSNTYTSSLAVDPKILNDLIKLGGVTTVGWNEGIRGKDDGSVFERDPMKNNLMTALRIAEPHIGQVRQLISRLDPEKSTKMEANPKKFKYHARPVPHRHELEAMDTCVDLLRNMIGGYDKIIDMSERFTKQKLTAIDPRTVQGYLSRKREYNAYIAKVEKVLRKRTKARQALEEVEEEADQPAETTWIEDRIKLALGDVDETLLATKPRRKMRDENSVPRLKPQLSRKLMSSRRGLITNTLTNELGAGDSPEFDGGIERLPDDKSEKMSSKERDFRDPHSRSVWKSFERDQKRAKSVLNRDEVEKAWITRQAEPETAHYSSFAASG